MRLLLMAAGLGLAACEAPASDLPPAPAPVELNVVSATVKDWQAIDDAGRLATMRAYSRAAFPAARDDQRAEIARRFVACMDHFVVTATPDDGMFDIARRCEDFAA